jgi:cytochrome c oxidase cbb3-type subunit 4
MFKFIKKYAETIDHIEIYPIISLVIFFLFFAGVLLFTYRMNKKEILEIKNLPLDLKQENIEG